MTTHGGKKQCPFCGSFFVGIAPDGIPFYDKHQQLCEKRTPPNAQSLPIQERITICLKCMGTEFIFIAQHGSLWEYACKDCGQHHTAKQSLNTITSEAPYNIKGPKLKPPRWDR